MEVASVSGSRPDLRAAVRARNVELTRQLRTAVMEGDDARIARLLSDLLRVQGLTKGQRISLQMKALLNLVESLRAAALNDELTGLYNRRGFVQSATRLLDVAVRDGLVAQLVYFDVAQLHVIDEVAGPISREVLIRQMGNFLRDLFPSYGVYEVLGRLATNEFAALTTSPEYASRSAILARARRPQRSSDIPVSSLRVGVAHFNPSRPVAIDELLLNAQQAINDPENLSRIASATELTPRTA